MILELMKKDFRFNKAPILLYFGIYAVTLVFFYFTFYEETFLYHMICIELIVILAFFTLGFDRLKKGEVLAVSLPVSRGQIVKARYLFAFLITALAMVVMPAELFLIDLIAKSGNIDVGSILTGPQIYTTFFLVFSIIIVTYPLIYRFGFIKGLVISFGTLFLILMFFPVILRSPYLNGIKVLESIHGSSHKAVLYPVISAVQIALLYISISLSGRCFQRQDI